MARSASSLNVPTPNHTFTQELLLTSEKSQRLQYTAGLYYFHWISSSDALTPPQRVCFLRRPEPTQPQ